MKNYLQKELEYLNDLICRFSLANYDNQTPEYITKEKLNLLKNIRACVEREIYFEEKEKEE